MDNKPLNERLAKYNLSSFGASRLISIASKYETIKMDAHAVELRDFMYSLCTEGQTTMGTILKVFLAMKLDKEVFEVLEREGFSGKPREEIFKEVFGETGMEQVSIITPRIVN